MRRPSRQGLVPVCVHGTSAIPAAFLFLLTGCFSEDDIPAEFKITFVRPPRPETDRWIRVADMPVGRQRMYGYSPGDAAYFGAGQYSHTRWTYCVWKLDLE